MVSVVTVSAKKFIYILRKGFIVCFGILSVESLSGIAVRFWGIGNVKAGTARKQKNRAKYKCRCFLKKVNVVCSSRGIPP